MKILVIHGPNLNMLGKRDRLKYGTVTLKEIAAQLCAIAKKCDCAVSFFQSNCEGAIIDFLQQDSSRDVDGVLINPGALVRYGYSLRQALIDLGKPVVEIHLSQINKTGVNKKVNVFANVCIDKVIGLKERSYYVGLERLIKFIKHNKS